MGKPAQIEQRVSEEEWQRIATASAIAAVRDVLNGMNQRAAISSLSDIELGWVVAAAIFGWIKSRAEQAVAEGTSTEVAIRTIKARQPEPWEAGAIHTVLPQLGSMSDVDWSKPVGEWSKDQITSFAWQIYKLTDQAFARRDEGAISPLEKFNRDKFERQNSAANRGPLLSLKEEMNDEIPF